MTGGENIPVKERAGAVALLITSRSRNSRELKDQRSDQGNEKEADVSLCCLRSHKRRSSETARVSASCRALFAWLDSPGAGTAQGRQNWFTPDAVAICCFGLPQPPLRSYPVQSRAASGTQSPPLMMPYPLQASEAKKGMEPTHKEKQRCSELRDEKQRWINIT